MKVVCIFPITNVSENYPKILSVFKEKIATGLDSLGAKDVEIKFAGTDYIFVSTNQTIKGKQKGEGILECLKNCGESPDCVMVCDGSGAIPYEYIVELFQEIISDLSICGVMANRIENKAISEERYFIERFEIFILKKYYNYPNELPDGQCGLWGYRAGKICANGNHKEIILTAKSYEIELDLLSELLEKQLKFSFIDIKLPPREVKSSFSFDSNINKMKFLLNKYPQLKEYLSTYMRDFENIEENKVKLDTYSIKDNWNKYKIEIGRLII